MEVFIKRPSVDLYSGIRVTKQTEIKFENENVQQNIHNLELHTVAEITGEGYVSKHETTIQLEEGDVLIFEEEGRGYIKPLEGFATIAEAIQDLENIKDLG